MSDDYIYPKDVKSPRASWTLIDVLEDLGPGGVAVALGRWDDEPVLAMRWNGTEDNRIGNPQSRGLPTWFILPAGKHSDAITEKLPPEKKALVRNFIPASDE